MKLDAKEICAFVYTVDVEDWYQVENLRSVFPLDRWGDCESRVEASTDRLLNLCEKLDVKGTFFVLGWLAKRYPSIVKNIASSGHEIACHGFNHELLTSMSFDQIRGDIRDSKALLEDLCGNAVVGYRAPNFSITDQALDILSDLGFWYDSSLYPFTLHDRYGKIDTSRLEPLAPGIHQHKKNGLIEFLLPMRNLGPITVPWAGGGYFRILPASIFRGGVKAVLNQGGPFVFYMHPWEIDHQQPIVSGLKTSQRFRHYIGLSRTFNRLSQLLKVFGNDLRLCDLATRIHESRNDSDGALPKAG